MPIPAWDQALRLLEQTAALRSLMLLHGDNGVGKSALVAHWLNALEPKVYLPLAGSWSRSMTRDCSCPTAVSEN